MPIKTDKQIKKDFLELGSKNPSKYYPLSSLKEKNFQRKKCPKCGRYFWTLSDDSHCGDSSCSNGYSFIGQKTSKPLSYLESWTSFEKFFSKQGYKPIKRYPVVARWRPDTYWVGASVYPFQPHVVEGNSKPPSDSIIIPQPCLRFNDIDNVGLTGAHYSCFTMFGQLNFKPQESYKPQEYFDNYFNWITKGMGIKETDVKIHEDGWAGAGFGGTSFEFFSKGLELGNQVYMQYYYTGSNYKDLNVKVLDMGQGQERIPWFTQGTPTSYSTTFPTILKYLFKQTGISIPSNQKDFVSLSSLLNADEYNLKESWALLSKKLSTSESQLKKDFLPLSALYSIADHSRAILFALSDSALPSNIGGGYNLRTLIRRMFSLSQEYSFSLDYYKLFELHTSFLKPLFNDIYTNPEEIQKIFQNEEKKFQETQSRAKSILSKSLTSTLTTKKLLELYDSHGISPELIKQTAEKQKIQIKIPDNFYSLLSEKHQDLKPKKEKNKLPIKTTKQTKPLFWDDWKITSFKSKVLEIKDNYVILEQTAFYPTSGGQEHDKGTINNQEVIDVIKQDSVILHLLKETPKFKVGDIINGEIDFQRRKSLTQHHTGAHLINLACREILGSHIWQAGASKSQDKARLDITHYSSLTTEEIKKIESLANTYISQDLPIKKEILPREEAEKKYSLRIYQGGFVPGKNLRIINIGNKEIEACGGTHLNSTKEIESIKILSSSKIQDSILRITFVCGSQSQKQSEKELSLLTEISALLKTPESQLVSAVNNLFTNWKRVYKKKKQPIQANLEKDTLSTKERLEKIAKILKTQPIHILKTLERMQSNLSQKK